MNRMHLKRCFASTTTSILYPWILEVWKGSERKLELTPGNYNPEKVHEKIIPPKVVRVGPRVLDVGAVKVEHTCGVVKDKAVKLAYTDDDLKRVTEGVGGCDQGDEQQAQRAPAEL